MIRSKETVQEMRRRVGETPPRIILGEVRSARGGVASSNDARLLDAHDTYPCLAPLALGVTW